MPKLQRLTSQEAEAMLLKAGFRLVRSKGSHRVYIKENKRVVVPFHTGRILHPKITTQVLKAVETDKRD
ncbi:MAG: type II toxin-antitoxin system HicA family toxin [Deltaproteobacteria bacterium]|nr:type II toxin-antitoxin system HicA family toxin [Deltaproteobacteria bacterium]